MVSIAWLTDFLTALASIATAVGVWYARSQLRQSTEQGRTQFEDGLSREYRDLARSLPVKALLGQELDGKEQDDSLQGFYHYVDLSNEQVFLRQNKRVSLPTWRNWSDGIRSNLERPAFRRAWNQIKEGATGSFEELRRLEQNGFRDDPADW